MMAPGAEMGSWARGRVMESWGFAATIRFGGALRTMAVLPPFLPSFLSIPLHQTSPTCPVLAGNRRGWRGQWEGVGGKVSPGPLGTAGLGDTVQFDRLGQLGSKLTLLQTPCLSSHIKSTSSVTTSGKRTSEPPQIADIFMKDA